MSAQEIKLYRPFEEKVARVMTVSLNKAFDRLKQSAWGEPNASRNVDIKVFHSNFDPPSDKVHFLAGEHEVQIEIHQNPELYSHIQGLVEHASRQRTFTRHSLARFIVSNGIPIHMN